jgi:1-deoxy-D-xylulose-5-phosphate reductoisomerase
MRRLAILGSTGSIGTSTLSVLEAFPERFAVSALAAGHNVERLVGQVVRHRPDLVAVADAATAAELGSALRHQLGPEAGRCRVVCGPEGTVRRLVLTASGGPFRCHTAEQLAHVTVDEALSHPTWKMGSKITIDSATLMNKGLEIIEAHHLFAMPEELIDVVVHPESLVHSLVEYVDGTFIAQLSINDMRFPIQYALAWPERLVSKLPTLDLAEVGRLSFERPDPGRFPALELARQALRAGGEMPAVLNAANEVAVGAFLEGGLGFVGIAGCVGDVLETWAGRSRPLVSLEQALAVDQEARIMARERLEKFVHPGRGSDG